MSAPTRTVTQLALIDVPRDRAWCPRDCPRRCDARTCRCSPKCFCPRCRRAAAIARRHVTLPIAVTAFAPRRSFQSSLFTNKSMFDNNAQEANTMDKVYRQGDVLIRQVVAIPDNLNAVPRDDGRVVLAYGEVTGHAHAITDPAAAMCAADITDLTRSFLKIEGEHAVALQHEEHDTILLPPGNYEVRRQREYQPEAPIWVAD